MAPDLDFTSAVSNFIAFQTNVAFFCSNRLNLWHPWLILWHPWSLALDFDSDDHLSRLRRCLFPWHWPHWQVVPGLSTSAVIATHDSDDLTSWLSPHPMSTLCHLCARHFVLPPKNELQCVCCSKGGRGLTGWTIPSHMCAPEKKLRLVGIACTLHWLWFMIHDCDSEVSPRGFCSHGLNSTLLWPTVTVIHDCDWDVSFGSFVNNISQSCMLAGTSWAHCFRNGCTSMRWRKATMTTPPPWKSVIGWTGQSVRANWRPGCGACGHSHTRHSPESRAVTLASWWSLSLVTVNGLTGPNCQSDPSWHWH